MNFNCYDVLSFHGYNSERMYLVQGVHVGALNQESVLELIPIDRTLPAVHGKYSPLIVPIEMIEKSIKCGLISCTSSLNSGEKKEGI